MSKLQQAIQHLNTDSTWQLMDDKQLFIDALAEIDTRLIKLEKK